MTQKLLMFLLDSEDLFGTQPKIIVKEQINRISAELENENHSKFLTCELYWNNLDINKQSSVRDVAGVISQTLEQLAEVQNEFFTKRRLLVYKNRLIALSILEKGEESLESSFQQLIELNLKEAENNLSQQNIAVVSILLGKASETSYLINKIIESDNVRLSNRSSTTSRSRRSVWPTTAGTRSCWISCAKASTGSTGTSSREASTPSKSATTPKPTTSCSTASSDSRPSGKTAARNPRTRRRT